MPATKKKDRNLADAMATCCSCSCAIPASIAISCVHAGCRAKSCKPFCYLKHLDTHRDSHPQPQ